MRRRKSRTLTCRRAAHAFDARVAESSSSAPENAFSIPLHSLSTMRCSIWWTFLASARGPSNAPSPSRISAGQRVIGYGGTTLLDPLSVPLRRDVRLLFDASSAAARERFFDLGPRSRDGVSESVPYSSFSVAPRVFSFELPSFRNFDARRGIANVLAREKRCDFERLLFLFLFLFLLFFSQSSPPRRGTPRLLLHASSTPSFSCPSPLCTLLPSLFPLPRARTAAAPLRLALKLDEPTRWAESRCRGPSDRRCSSGAPRCDAGPSASAG